MVSFKSDLEKGEAIEEVVIDKLKDEWIVCIKNPDVKGADLLIIEDSIEVKFDEMSNKTWNYFFEVECNWKPSWVYRKEEVPVKYWAHSDWNTTHLISMKFLTRWISNRMDECSANKSNTSRGARIIESWGDWWRVRWLLVPKAEIENISYKTIYENKV